MRKVILATLAMSGLPLLCSGQSGLSGTWKMNVQQMDFSKKPDVYLLTGGVYDCKTCEPPEKVKADGSDQPVTDNPYYNTAAIDVVNDHEIKETDKKNGKVVATSTVTVSSDGNTLAFDFSDSSNTNGGPPVTGKGAETRVSKGPAGSHLISGSWQMSKMENLSANAATYTFAFKGDELTMTSPMGSTYTAKLDGSDAPVKGDPGVTSVSVKMLAKDTLEETYKRDGKPIMVIKTTLAPDGKTVHVVNHDKQQDRTAEFTATKQ
jgi:hypothetical protein